MLGASRLEGLQMEKQIKDDDDYDDEKSDGPALDESETSTERNKTLGQC